MGEFQLQLKRKFVPDGELLADLRRVAALLGRATLSREVYGAHGRFSALTLRKRFGGWGGALAAAGLAPSGYHYAGDGDLFENLAAVWRALGRQPVMDDMQPARGLSRYSPDTYHRRFGSWNAALLRFSGYLDGSDWRSGSRGDAWATAKTAEPQISQIPQIELPQRATGEHGVKLACGSTQMNNSRRTPGWRLRARVLLRDRSTCQMCGASPAKDPRTVLHVDHIVPWSQGGETVEANLRTLCEACNVGKGDCELPATE